jgi:hypothetical protein
MTDVVIIFNSLITIAYLGVIFCSLGVRLELQQHSFLRRLDEHPPSPPPHRQAHYLQATATASPLSSQLLCECAHLRSILLQTLVGV